MVRLFTIVSLLAVAVIPAAAQDDVLFFKQRMAGGIGLSMPFGAPEEAIATATAALSLSDAQVSGLRALLTQRAEVSKTAFQELAEKQKALHTVLTQQNPPALDIGNAYLAVHTAQNNLKSNDEKFQSDFRALLTPAQRTTLENLQTATKQIDSLRMLGVLGGDHGTFNIAIPPIGAMPAVGPLTAGERQIRIFRRNEAAPR
jgi:Spy/CpxP family protein refolding chaperone